MVFPQNLHRLWCWMCEIRCLTCELQLFNDFRLTNLRFTELQLDVQAAFLAVYHGACYIVACCLANSVISYRRRTHCHLVQRQVDDGNFFERLWIDDLCLVWKGLTLLTNMGNDKGMAGWSRRCPVANAYYSLSTKNKRIKTDEMQTFDMFMFLFRLIWGQGSKYPKMVSELWIFWKDETCLNAEVDWDVVCLQRVWQISRYVRLRCQDCWRNSTWQT